MLVLLLSSLFSTFVQSHKSIEDIQTSQSSFSLNIEQTIAEGSKYSHLVDTSHNFESLDKKLGQEHRQSDFGRSVKDLYQRKSAAKIPTKKRLGNQ